MPHNSPIHPTTDTPTGQTTLVAREYHLGLRDRLVAMVDKVRHPASRFERYMEAWKGIPGWLSASQAKRLFDLAQTVQADGDVVEIGSAFGRSAIPLALGTRCFGRGRLFCIDPHTGGIGLHEEYGDLAKSFSSLGSFLENVVRFELQNVIVPMVLPSEEAAKVWNDKPIRLLFVDGWHSYEACQRDIFQWGRFVAPGGVMVVHDYDWKEVRRAVDESIPQLGGFGEVTSPDQNMAIVHRRNAA
jgi:predicted O-methyltransferase YrrM